jgi:hypothetical protein
MPNHWNLLFHPKQWELPEKFAAKGVDALGWPE